MKERGGYYGAVKESAHFVDVICQHKTDGSIIPMRIRMMDDDGQYQTYTIRSFKELSHSGQVLNPDQVIITSHTWTFQCRIAVFGTEKTIRLFYNAYENSWRLTY